MNIRHIDALRGITQMDGNVHIGALTTISELRDSDLIRERFASLWQACDHFASDQVRNAATLGGNICNASPAGDTLVPLLAFEARVVLASKPNGALARRIVALDEFLLGPGRTARGGDELLVGVEIALPPPDGISTFFKFGTRPALDISVVSIGFAASRAGGRLRSVRLAFGAVAPRPVRARKTEAMLEGQILDPNTIAAAAAAADTEIRPISDVRASDWYRREMIRNALIRMLTHVRDR
jgi:CO/xanthine dehydrogenase FAD-binding subunit